MGGVKDGSDSSNDGDARDGGEGAMGDAKDESDADGAVQSGGAKSPVQSGGAKSPTGFSPARKKVKKSQFNADAYYAGFVKFLEGYNSAEDPLVELMLVLRVILTEFEAYRATPRLP